MGNTVGAVGRTVRDKVQLGPSEDPNVWAPRPASSAHSDTDVPAEAAEIARAVLEEGAVTRGDLADMVAARRWGPAQFQRALKYALAHNMIRHVGRGVYAAPRQADRRADGTARDAEADTAGTQA
jgi:hypothetical protein